MPATPSEGWPDARPGNTVAPLDLVRRWYEEAEAEGLFEPDAMALATASPDGMPSVRIVLLKGIDDRGLRFFTNYGSRKGRELDANPRAAVTIHWATMHRAVRAEGAVERLTAEESDAYFASRGRESRLGAWASRQGTPIPGRATLESAFAAAAARYPGDDVPRPDYWGGYRLVPDAIELWQGRSNRLHDREHFLREPGGGWRSERLSP
jgi:pyridoxamine 5'-phosphate oxidase